MQNQTAYVAPKANPELSERDCILRALDAWVRQRPGLDPRDYGDSWPAYRSESRSITRDLHHARTLLRYVELHPSITADMLREAFRSAYSGRLSWDAGKRQLDYCTGQYWPTEYRRAACAVLASAIWYWFRSECMPEPDAGTPETQPERYRGKSAGDFIRSGLRRELGATIQKRWLD